MSRSSRIAHRSSRANPLRVHPREERTPAEERQKQGARNGAHAVRAVQGARESGGRASVTEGARKARDYDIAQSLVEIEEFNQVREKEVARLARAFTDLGD